MADREITYRREPRGQWTLWAYHTGTLREAKASARGLKRSLREDEHCPRAIVAVDGKRVNGE